MHPTEHADTPPANDGATVRVEGRIRLFGFEATPAAVRIRIRGRAWRAGRAGRTLLVGALVTPLVALVPPHAPWALGALVGSAVLAWRRWSERHTLVEAAGPCPACGEPLELPGGVRLRSPHPVSCERCHHECALVLAAPPPGLAEAA